ncbi:alpha/beta fold hydrolase, partial [Streptomyces avidinii]
MGRAFHWAGTARWLRERHRVVALDQRGHGQSGRPPAETPTSLGREAFVADAEAAVEQLGLAPVTLIGHSMGALTAWQLAARRPDLVEALVICDMRASALGAASQEEWEDWFHHWPLPFPTQDAARRWFGEDDPRVERPDPGRGAFFAEVMHEAPDGWRRSSPGARCSRPVRPGSTTRTGRSWPRSAAPRWWSAASTANWAGPRPRRWSASSRRASTRKSPTPATTSTTTSPRPGAPSWNPSSTGSRP